MESAAIMVIPCYNEATRLQVSTFKAFICMRPAVRFLFVDDGSTDRTWQVLEGCIRTIPSTLPSITMLRTEARLRPYVRGSCAPLRPVQSMGYWDADLATPLDTLVAFCELLETHPDIEMVFGARCSCWGA